MATQNKRQVRYTKAFTQAKVKENGLTVVSSALVKPGSSNLRPKIHVKRGDMVVLISGPKKVDKNRSPEQTRALQERNAFKGTVGKVTKVLVKEGKVIVEGVNMLAHFVRGRAAITEAGIVRKEAPIPACKVMLWDPQKKTAVRASKRKELSL